jgi:hypothetical protein
VVDEVAPFGRARERVLALRIADIAERELDVREPAAIGFGADERADGNAAGEQRVDQVRADEAGRPGDEDRSQGMGRS